MGTVGILCCAEIGYAAEEGLYRSSLEAPEAFQAEYEAGHFPNSWAWDGMDDVPKPHMLISPNLKNQACFFRMSSETLDFCIHEIKHNVLHCLTSISTS